VNDVRLMQVCLLLHTAYLNHWKFSGVRECIYDRVLIELLCVVHV